MSFFQIDTTVSGSIGHTCGASKRLFDDVADSEATDCDDADDTDVTDEIKTEPDVKVQLLLNNVMAVTTKGESKANYRSTWEDSIVMKLTQQTILMESKLNLN